MTFNNNLGDYSSRGSSSGFDGGGGGANFGGRGGGGNNMLMYLLMSLVSRKFGLPGVIILGIGFFLFTGPLQGMFSSSQNAAAPQQGPGSGSFAHCKTAADANRYDDCRMLAGAKALDTYWSKALPAEAGISYTQPGVTLGEGQVRTACGAANMADTGPFYCPGDNTVYMSTRFFDQLQAMGGSNGAFSQLYVLAHEFGHHIQQLEGTLKLSDYNNPGAESNAVKIELQADCYAGMWAQNADKGQGAMLDPVTPQQVNEAIRSAQAIGDDTIQRNSGRGVNPDKWTHGSSEQRVAAFERGYQAGTMDACRVQFN